MSKSDSFEQEIQIQAEESRSSEQEQPYTESSFSTSSYSGVKSRDPTLPIILVLWMIVSAFFVMALTKSLSKPYSETSEIIGVEILIVLSGIALAIAIVLAMLRGRFLGGLGLLIWLSVTAYGSLISPVSTTNVQIGFIWTFVLGLSVAIVWLFAHGGIFTLLGISIWIILCVFFGVFYLQNSQPMPTIIFFLMAFAGAIGTFIVWWRSKRV